MKILLNNIGKRYGYKWVLRHIDLSLNQGEKYAIIGSNGSGKSTILKILSGFLTPSEGQVQYYESDKQLSVIDIYKSVAFAAPYIDLIESFTLREVLSFHYKFKKLPPSFHLKDIEALLNLKIDKDQRINSFSSGMQQRLKLVLAICSDTPILMLDEPTSNLDQQGISWYHNIVRDFAKNRLVVVASNVAEDYHFCNEVYDVQEWKKGGMSLKNRKL